MYQNLFYILFVKIAFIGVMIKNEYWIYLSKYFRKENKIRQSNNNYSKLAKSRYKRKYSLVVAHEGYLPQLVINMSAATSLRREFHGNSQLILSLQISHVAATAS